MHISLIGVVSRFGIPGGKGVGCVSLKYLTFMRAPRIKVGFGIPGDQGGGECVLSTLKIKLEWPNQIILISK